MSTPVLHYINPAQHPQFLDSIVKSHLQHLSNKIRKSLALSIRVDGSVDRTQDHNVFVLVNLVNRDGVMETVFLGFSIPENEEVENDGAAAYLKCIKTVVKNVLPWEDFLKLSTSLITDGASKYWFSKWSLCQNDKRTSASK